MKFRKSAVKITAAVLLIAAIVVLCIVFWGRIADAILFILSLLTPFIIAYMLSLIVNPLAQKLQKKLKLPKGLTAILVIILTVVILGGIVVGGIWKIASEIKSIYLQFPQIYEDAQASFNSFKNYFSDIYNAFPKDVQEMFTAMGEDIQNGITRFINRNYKPVVMGAGNFAKQLPSIFIGIIVFVLSLYFMISNPDNIEHIMEKIIPRKMSASMSRVCSEIKKYIGGYVKAQLIIMLIAFVVICIGLTIINIQYAMLIAAGIAIFDALPFFGSGAVLWPWSVISFINGDFKTGIGTVIIYLAVVLTRQMIEPKIVSSNIGINPLLTLFSMYCGYKVFSIGGLILGPIILMLFMSFYKAGVFNRPIELLKKFIIFIKSEIRELYKNLII